MPATSSKQKKFMDAAAHNPKFAQQAGIPQKVAKDFSEASKGMQFKGGARTRADLQKVNDPKTLHGKTQLYKKGGNTMATKKMNPFAKFEKSSKDTEMKGVKEGSPKDRAMDKMQMKKMASGGSASSRADGIAQRGKTKGKMLAKGGKT
jgi:hypothetical protein